MLKLIKLNDPGVSIIDKAIYMDYGDLPFQLKVDVKGKWLINPVQKGIWDSVSIARKLNEALLKYPDVNIVYLYSDYMDSSFLLRGSVKKRANAPSNVVYKRGGKK
jgi:hypothetical protein